MQIQYEGNGKGNVVFSMDMTGIFLVLMKTKFGLRKCKLINREDGHGGI